MEGTIRIGCAVVSHIGSDRISNDDRIYVNGRFLQTYQIDNSHISLEAVGNQFIFAVSDCMDIEIDESSKISITEELKKFHKKTRNSTKDIQIKLDEMVEQVQQSNNLLYSLSLGGETGSPCNTAFAGLIIDGGSIAAVNLGNCRIYKLDSENLKPVINDFKRTERLLKMGIINDEQAEMLSGKQKSSSADGSLKVKKSEIFPVKEGNVYLLCSNGLIDSVSEDTIYGILSDNFEIDAAAELLVKEAVKNGSEDNVTAMVVRIHQVQETAAPVNQARNVTIRRLQASPARYSRIAGKNKLDMAKLVSTFIIFAVIAAVVFGAFTFWLNLRKPGKDKDVLSQNTTRTSDASGSNARDTVPDDSEEAEGAQSSTSVVPENNSNNGDVNGGADTPIGDNTTYTVKAGDNLLKISRQFYGDESKYKLIMQANNITDPDKIKIGQILKIPPAN